MTQLAPHQQRVVEERTELADRLRELMDFLDSPVFLGLDVSERMRLREQAVHMARYLRVLDDRIEAFNG